MYSNRKVKMTKLEAFDTIKSEVPYEAISEDDEAFFSAVDKRKYKFLQTIDCAEYDVIDESSNGSVTGRSLLGSYGLINKSNNLVLEL